MADRKVEFLLTAKDRTAAAFDSVNRRLESLDKLAIGAAAGGIAAVVGGLGVLTARAFQANDSLGKIADTIGLSTRELAGFRQAAEYTGVGADAIDKALQKMTRSVGDAIRGVATQTDAFGRLNIEIDSFARMDPGEQFKTVADRIGTLGTRSEQAAVAAAIFGREGINMLNTLDLGRDGLEEITDEMDRFGVALDRVEVAQIEAANDAFTRAQAAAAGVGNQIAVKLAPLVEEVANRFADAAAESDGFSNTLQTAGEIGITALGFVADRAQDVYRGFLVLAATAAQVEASVRGFFGIGDQKDIDDALARVDDAFKKLDDSIADGSLGDRLRAEIDDIRAAAKERAEAVAEEVRNRQETQTGEGVEIGETIAEKNARERAEERAKKDAEREAERAAQKLAALEESLLSEEEAELRAYERRRAIIEENLSAEGEDAQRRAELLERLEEQHQKRMSEIEKKGLSDRAKFERMSTTERVKFLSGQLVALTQGTAQSSKTMFQINKIAAIANATVSTSEAITKTLAAYPYPINIAMAALTGAAGLAQINAIRSTSFSGGGGGTTPSAAGTTPVINDVPVQTPAEPAGQRPGQGGATQIVINGNFYGNEEAIRELMDAIEDRINAGDEVFISSSSRQAQVIRSAPGGG